jgi:hypothetical protein
VVLDDVEEPLPAHLAEFRRQVNDGEHHREGDGCGPQQRWPEGGAGTCVSSDGGGIIVRCPRDQAEAKSSDSASPTLFFSWLASVSGKSVGPPHEGTNEIPSAAGVGRGASAGAGVTSNLLLLEEVPLLAPGR